MTFIDHLSETIIESFGDCTSIRFSNGAHLHYERNPKERVWDVTFTIRDGFVKCMCTAHYPRGTPMPGVMQLDVNLELANPKYDPAKTGEIVLDRLAHAFRGMRREWIAVSFGTYSI